MTALEDTWRIFVSLGNNAQLFFSVGTYTLLIPLDGWMESGNTLKKLFKFVL